MKKHRFSNLLYVLIGLILAACSPSRAEVGTQATQVAEAVMATLTAQAPPTSTALPPATATTAPTATPTLTPTPEALTAAAVFDLVSPAIAFIDTPAGTGSGVLTEGGYLVTNAHVVWPFQEVRVVFPEGQEYLEAPVLAWDLVADLAVVGPLETEVKPVSLEAREAPIIGGDIYLIGYPGEVEAFPQPTMTRGLISRLREWEAIDMTYFQVDAKITGGQSGGVLVSEKGEVIGISGFYFSDAEFGLVASLNDLLPRLEQLIAGETAIGFSDRRIEPGQDRLEHEFSLQDDLETRVFVFNEPVGTVVDIKVEGKENHPGFTVFDVFGELVAEAEEGDRQVETASVTVEVEAPYFIELFQFEDEPGEFQLSSSHKLSLYEDPDDQTEVTVEQTIVANIDTPADVDYFAIKLEADELIQITADSVLVDPWIAIYYDGAAGDDMIYDDNSGGGVFGLNPEIIYQAPRRGRYLIRVTNTDYYSTGGYHLTVGKAPADATPTEPPVASSSILTQFGPMDLYESEAYHFNIRYPGQWSDTGADAAICRQATACFLNEGGGGLVITEDEFQGLGLGDITLAEYTDVTLSVLESSTNEFELISRETVETLQGLPVEIIVFSFQKGLFKGSRLIYLYEDDVAFNATYLVGKAGYDLMKPVVDYSFESFRVWEPGQEAQDPVFHLDKGVKLAADDEAEAAIEAFSTAIELDPELVEAYTRRASAYRGAGELAKALEDSSKAIELRPDDRSLYYDRALTQWYLLDYPQAIADIDYAIQLDPGDYDAYNIRALIQATQGDYEAALASVNQAFSLDDPGNAPLLDTRGYIYIKMEQFDQAKADFEAIFDQDLRFPYALLGAGLAYGGLGETDEAIELLEEGLAEVEDTESPDPQLADLIKLAEKQLAELKE